MNLYSIDFAHYAPKDRRDGIFCFIIAEDDEGVYEWIKAENEVNGNRLYNSYECCEEEEEEFDIYDDDYNVIGTENFKEKMIRLHGEMNDEDADISDSYYGVTHIGWTLIQECISTYEIEVLEGLSILS